MVKVGLLVRVDAVPGKEDRSSVGDVVQQPTIEQVDVLAVKTPG
jgi:hypothetical protein